jgi:hypothetical protein
MPRPAAWVAVAAGVVEIVVAGWAVSKVESQTLSLDFAKDSVTGVDRGHYASNQLYRDRDHDDFSTNDWHILLGFAPNCHHSNFDSSHDTCDNASCDLCVSHRGRRQEGS